MALSFAVNALPTPGGLRGRAWPCGSLTVDAAPRPPAGPREAPSSSLPFPHAPFLGFLSRFPGGSLNFRFRRFHPTAQFRPAYARRAVSPRTFPSAGRGPFRVLGRGRFLLLLLRAHAGSPEAPTHCPSVSGSLLWSHQTRTWRQTRKLAATEWECAARCSAPASCGCSDGTCPPCPHGPLHPTVSYSASTGVPPSPTWRVWDLLADLSSARWAPAPATEAAGLCGTRPSSPCAVTSVTTRPPASCLTLGCCCLSGSPPGDMCCSNTLLAILQAFRRDKGGVPFVGPLKSSRKRRKFPACVRHPRTRRPSLLVTLLPKPATSL